MGEARHDAHAKPPDILRPIFKRYQRATPQELDEATDVDLLDLSLPLSSWHKERISCGEPFEDTNFRSALSMFTAASWDDPVALPKRYLHKHIPGLQIIPSLFAPEVQPLLLDRIIHRDLVQSHHTTNVHLHYNVCYPPASQSFFSIPPDSEKTFQGLGARARMPVTSFLNSKLRWLTLGGQYDWTAKRYPKAPPPLFPPDTAALIHDLFPDMLAQAAIVNFYSPGDTLSMHRDVSEDCDRGLVSVSLGCDAGFMAALEDETLPNGIGHVSMRLRSGDAVYMSGPARYAWHGVPRVIEGTCPACLEDWPAPEYPEWKGWMSKKRINLNVRQMYEDENATIT